MAARTGASAQQQADEQGLDPILAYEAAVDTAARPNAISDKEQDGVDLELNGPRDDAGLGAFAALANRPMAEPPLGGAGVVPITQGHNANLVVGMLEDERSKLARDLLEEIDSAEESRKGWHELMVKGVKALGFDRAQDQRSDPFVGASAVVHPAFAKSLVDMQARIAGQLAPPEGPAKTVVVGKKTKPEEERADRIALHINWQCCDQMSEWFDETDRLLMMVPAEGSSFKKTWYDQVEKRPRTAYIPAEQIIMPYTATCVQTSPLVAEEMWLLPHQVQEKLSTGFWAPHRVGEPSERPPSIVRQATDQIIGLDEMGGQDQPEYRGLQYYEVMVTRAIPGLEGGQSREYLVTVSREHQQLVAVRRNWRMTDRLRRRRRVLQHYKLFPWRGAYGLGLWHMIGGLSTSATGSLRALMDSAQWQNMPGGFRLKGSRTSGQTVTKRPGDYVEVEAAPGVTDIKQALMADPHPGPSPVLLELLGVVTTDAREFAGIALQETAESTQNTPVGTTLARVDEGSRVYSGVFQRLHRAQGLELKSIWEIDLETWQEQAEFYPFEVPNLVPEDFREGISVVPVSDPRTYSQIQRALQAQARVQLATEAQAQGVKVDLRSAYEDAAKALQLPGIETLFPPEPPPLASDPFTENAAVMGGGKLLTKPEQPHEEHLIVHLGLFALPGFGVTPAGQELVKHYVQHAGMGALSIAMAGKMAKEKMLPAPGMPDPGQWYTSWMNRLAPFLLPPGDPSVDKLVKVEQAKVEATRERVQVETDAKKQISAADTQAKKEIVAAELAADLRRIEAEDDRAEAKAMVDVTNQREKTASAERQKAADIMAKAATPPPPPKPMPPLPGKAKKGAK